MVDYVIDYGQVFYCQDGLIEKVYMSNIEFFYVELEYFVYCVGGGNKFLVGGE